MVDPADDELDVLMDAVNEEMGESRLRAESWVEERLLRAREQTRAEPLKMLAISAGIGVVLGALFLRF